MVVMSLWCQLPAYDINLMNKYKTNPQRSLATSNPIPHRNGFTKCFTDAAWHARSGMAGLGWIIDSSSTTILKQSLHVSNVTSALIAEALALRSAVIQATTLQFQDVVFYSDSQTLIRAINLKNMITEIHGCLEDIGISSGFFRNVVFCFIPRSENSIADGLAKLGLRPVMDN